MTEHLRPAELVEHVTALLTELGDTTEAITARLTGLGLTGEPGEPRTCPIARWLHHSDPNLMTVAVIGDVIDVDTLDGLSVTVNAPDPVGDFVSLFDTNRIPQLVASPQLDPLADPGTTLKEA